MTIQEKAKKIMTVVPSTDYRYKIAEVVARTKTDLLRHNSVKMVERTYKFYFGRG